MSFVEDDFRRQIFGSPTKRERPLTSTEFLGKSKINLDQRTMKCSAEYLFKNRNLTSELAWKTDLRRFERIILKYDVKLLSIITVLDKNYF